jgi:hypothetical protein
VRRANHYRTLDVACSKHVRSTAIPRAVLVLVAACGSSSPPPAAPVAQAPQNQCAKVADHLLSLMTDAAREAPAEELDRVRVAFLRHCEDDRWSSEAQRCFLALASKADVDRCATHLTDEQRQSLEQPPAK